MGRLIDLTGQRFGRLVVQHRTGVYAGNGDVLWRCNCDCGTSKDISGAALRKGVTVSCGCFNAENCAKINFSHGGSFSAEYGAWKGMKRRCYNPKQNWYSLYGGRGIRVCPEWLNDFAQFFADMGVRPSTAHSLDRIDPDGNYEPSNCRWAAKDVQSRNRRTDSRNKTGHSGVYADMRSGKFVAEIKATTAKRVYLGSFQALEEATAARRAAEKEYWGVC